MASGKDMYGQDHRGGPSSLLQQQSPQPHLHTGSAADLFEPLPQHKFLRRKTGCSVRWLRWRCVWGAALLHFCLGSVHTLGNLLPYITAYMRAKQQTPTISYRDGLDVYAWAIISQGVGGFFGTLVEKKIGTRRCCLFGSSVLSLGLALCGFCAHDHALLLLSFGIVAALGCGLCYPVPLAAALRFSSPKDKARVSGLLFFARSFSVCCLCPLQSLFMTAPERLIPSWISPILLRITSSSSSSLAASSSVAVPLSGSLSQNNNAAALQDMSGERFITDPVVLERLPYLFFWMAGSFAVLQVIGVLLLTEAQTAAAALAEEAEAEQQKLLDVMWKTLPLFPEAAAAAASAVAATGDETGKTDGGGGWTFLQFFNRVCSALGLSQASSGIRADSILPTSSTNTTTTSTATTTTTGTTTAPLHAATPTEAAAAAEAAAAGLMPSSRDSGGSSTSSSPSSSSSFSNNSNNIPSSVLTPTAATATARAATSPWSTTGQQWRDVGDFNISLLGALLAASCCLGRLLWGAIGDGLGYMRSTNIMNGIIIPLLFLLPSYGMHSPSLFASCLLSLNLCYGGIFSLFPSLTSDLFGRKNVGPVFSLLFGARIVSVALASIVIKVLLRYGSLWIVFIFLALCHFLSVVLTFFFHPTDALPYRFPMCTP